MQAASNEAISARAYQLWEEEGRPHGRDGEHWARAAAELVTNGSAPVATAPVKRTAKPKMKEAAAPADVPTKRAPVKAKAKAEPAEAPGKPKRKSTK